jgi:uncharacterized SAM-binding protein YcdF (DUF218 family)
LTAPPKPRLAPHRLAVMLAAVIVVVAIAAWLGGLFWFAHAIPTHVADPDTPTDAIVVLTGGSERLEAGLALLAEGRARKLFVSGVYRGVDVDALLRLNHASAGLECCIVLGHAADSTLGNAIETMAWLEAEHYRSLRLVTAAYHMPRSLLEFRRVMPDITIVPNPVFPGRVKRDDWWRWPGTAALIVEEYSKYLLALLRGNHAAAVVEFR